MKFTLSWLKSHLQTEATLDQITDTLTQIGLELEGIETPGAALASFRVAHVIEAVQHPNADRLRACKVDTGDGIVSVVCGAPNARSGIKVVFAAPGAHIPGTGITLKVGEIRGVQSAGMLLSAREMGLGDDHAGIIELPADAPIGTSYAAWAGLDDPVIEIGVTPNRGDCISVRGVARDLAATGLGNPEAVLTPGHSADVRWRPALGHRLPGSLPVDHRPHHSRREEFAQSEMAAGSPDLHRAAANQCARRCNEFLYLRPRSSTACIRRR